MAIKVYNTMSRALEDFIPIRGKEVGMYVCGPTVYGPGHIGHARTYTAFDMIRRYLKYRGYKVKYVVNITDVHDDIIKRASEQGVTIFALVDKNIALFLKDLDSLGIKRPDVMPRVTEHINEIIAMVDILEKNGFAYETDDGVYFSVSKFKTYGKLSRIKSKKSVTGTRIETDKYEKHAAMDFALWKKAKPGEPSWPSKWGPGRPGWHIECSAMSSKYLGQQFDIHGGAVDLVFPHHENEICQSEACFGKAPFVKYWLHAGFLNVAGEKMSKSLGNFITIPELLEKYDARAFRHFISSLHYRSRIDFNEKAMAESSKALEKWGNAIQALLSVKGKVQNPEVNLAVEKARAGFVSSMDSDFNLPNAWAVLNEFLSEINRAIAAGKISENDAQACLTFLKELDSIFGFFRFEKKQEEALPKELQDLFERREAARKARDFVESDRIRAELAAKGIEIIDTPQGAKWKRI